MEFTPDKKLTQESSLNPTSMSEGIKIDDGFQDEMNIQEFPAENLILQKTLSGGALFQQMLEEQAR